MSPEHQEVNLESSETEGDLSPYLLEARRARAEVATVTDLAGKKIVAFKFGGSSLFGSDRLLHSARIVKNTAETSSVIVTVSAMKGVTDRLLRVAQQIANGEWEKAAREAEHIVQLHLDTLHDLHLPQEDRDRVAYELKLLSRDLLHETQKRGHKACDTVAMDRIASFGERFTSRLFAATLEKLDCLAVPVASSDFVLTCDHFQNAQPHMEQTKWRGRDVLLPLLDAGIVPVVTGFIGATHDGRITTLGRNSSDYSGAIVAHVVDAAELVIWTDVDGIYTGNPHVSGDAKLLHDMTYDEAHALALGGAKVLHPQVLPLAAETGMTVWVRNTFKPQQRGTRIAAKSKGGVA